MKFNYLLALMAVSSAIKVEKYDGPLPAQFDSSKGGDAFMEKVIKELSTTDGNGKFYVSKDAALSISNKVMTENAEMHSFWAKLHVDENFDKCWKHFDNMNEGKIQADQVYSLYKMLAQDNTLQFWWEVPKKE